MNGCRYAVLVASSQFQDPSLENLLCPENDVDGLNAVLTSKEVGNFTETMPLKNLPHYEILLKIEQILEKAGKNDLVLIYYSGHGKQDRTGKLHLVATNTKVNYLKSTSIPMENIKSLIEASRTNKIILILDCCFSGLAGDAFLRGGADDQLQSLSRARGTYIMTASTGLQVALEKESEKFGLFTKHIIEGIQDFKAANNEGYITMDGLYNYVHKQMIEEDFQTPMKWDLNIEGDIIIAGIDKSKNNARDNHPNGSVEIKTSGYDKEIYDKSLETYERLSNRLKYFDEFLQSSKKSLEQKRSSDRFQIESLERSRWNRDAIASIKQAQDSSLRYMEDRIERLKGTNSDLKLGLIDLKNILGLYRISGDPDKLNEFEETIKKINKLCLDCELVQFLNDKGCALYALDKYDEAIQAYDDAIWVDPDYATAWNNKGLALAAQNKYDDAIRAYDQAILLDPNDAVTWYKEGNVFNALGRYDEAIKCFDEAIKLDPKYEDALKAYNETFRANGGD